MRSVMLKSLPSTGIPVDLFVRLLFIRHLIRVSSLPSQLLPLQPSWAPSRRSGKQVIPIFVMAMYKLSRYQGVFLSFFSFFSFPLSSFISASIKAPVWLKCQGGGSRTKLATRRCNHASGVRLVSNWQFVMSDICAPACWLYYWIGAINDLVPLLYAPLLIGQHVAALCISHIFVRAVLV